jgi:hypothetical protein
MVTGKPGRFMKNKSSYNITLNSSVTPQSSEMRKMKISMKEKENKAV